MKILILTMFFALNIVTQAQQPLPDYWWTEYSSVFDGQYCRWHATWGTVTTGFGLFKGSTPDEMHQFLPDSSFKRIVASNQNAWLADGTWIISGGTFATETRGTTYLFTKPSDSPRVLTFEDLDSQNVGGGIADGNNFRGFEPNAFAILDSYSTDRGVTWVRAPIPDSLKSYRGQTAHFLSTSYNPTKGFFAFAQADSSWHWLNLETKRWEATNSLPTSVGYTEFLEKGSAVSLAGSNTNLIVGLARRASESDSWVYLNELDVPSEAAIPFPKIDVSNVSSYLVRINDSVVVMALDKGYVVVATGSSFTAYRLPLETRVSAVNRGPGGFAVKGDSVVMKYSHTEGLQSINNTVLFNVKTGQSKVVVSGTRLYSLLWNGEELLSTGVSTMLNKVDLERGVLQPTGKCYSADGQPQRPREFLSVRRRDSSILSLSSLGDVLTIGDDGSSPYWMKYAKLLTSTPESRSRFEIGNSPLAVSDFGLFSFRSNGLFSIEGHNSRAIRKDTISAASQPSKNVLYAGFRKLFMSEDEGTTWSDVPDAYKEATSKPAISSIIPLSSGRIVIGYRGYVISKDGELKDSVPGGIWTTDNDGVTWAKSNVPADLTWIENVVQVDDNVLLCWASRPTWDVWSNKGQFRWDNWYLLRSTDNGGTWKSVHTESYNLELASNVSWSIDHAPAVIVASSDKAILVSVDNGLSWKEKSVTPFNTRISGVALDARQQLWVSTDKGLYVRSLLTSIDENEKDLSTQFKLSVSPNPVSNSASIRFVNFSALGQGVSQVRLKLVDYLGRTVRELPIDGNSVSVGNEGSIVVDVSDLQNGTYYVVCSTNTGIHCEPMLVLN
ncbi:MAG: hypothetical protein HQ472_05130 [Ignavibacteria bacterium]|nr:hypothetical protein [Ignavibacteria bacterium]